MYHHLPPRHQRIVAQRGRLQHPDGRTRHAASFLTAKTFSPWHARRYEGTQAAYRFLLSDFDSCDVKPVASARRNPSLCGNRSYVMAARQHGQSLDACAVGSAGGISLRATKQEQSVCGEMNAVLFCSSAGCFIINLSRSAVDLMLETAS